MRGAPEKTARPFDLKVGDWVRAEDTILGGFWVWRVIYISDHIFCARRVDNEQFERGFRKLDYIQGVIEKVEEVKTGVKNGYEEKSLRTLWKRIFGWRK